MTTGTFSIDDAFNSDEDDKIRLYGATRDTAPFKGAKIREAKMSTSSEIPLQEYSHDDQSDTLLSNPDANTKPSHPLVGGHSSYSLSSTWSAETRVSTKSFPEGARWWKHPRIKENFRVVIGAFALTFIGLALLITGTVIVCTPQRALLITGIVIVCTPQRGWHSLVFFIGGALCFIPGAYHVGYIYLAIRGHAGYNLYNLPVFR